MTWLIYESERQEFNFQFYLKSAAISYSHLSDILDVAFLLYLCLLSSLHL